MPQPPHNHDAERSVLGGLLLDSRTADASDVVAMLPPDAFHYAPHRNLYGVIADMIRSASGADEVSVSHRCPAHQMLIAELTANVSTAANVLHHAQIVLDAWLARQLIAAAHDVIGAASAPDAKMSDVIATHGGAVAEIAELVGTRRLQDLVDVMSSRSREFLRIADGEKIQRGVLSGFVDLDAVLGGFKPGQLIVLAARPGAGKTSLELGFLLASGILKGAALAFSLEMTAAELGDRSIAWLGRLDLQRLTNLQVTPSECTRAVEVTERARGNLRVLIDDSPHITLDRIRAKSRQVKAQRGLSLIAVDYLQLMSGPGESREREVANISRGLKQLAKELEVPIVALSQLNRGPEARETKEPFVSDLRESGSLEQDADVILLLWRNPEEPQWVTCKIAKHRNGPQRDVQLGWYAPAARFQNMSHQMQVAG